LKISRTTRSEASRAAGLFRKLVEFAIEMGVLAFVACRFLALAACMDGRIEKEG
jgi:hypothetical protein